MLHRCRPSNQFDVNLQVPGLNVTGEPNDLANSRQRLARKGKAHRARTHTHRGMSGQTQTAPSTPFAAV